jgi:hypothetical protein
MNKSVDLKRIRSALRGKQLVGFKPGPNSKAGRSKAGAGKIGAGKTGVTKQGPSKRGPIRKTS